MKELVNQYFLIFPKYQMDAKKSSALWYGGGNMKPWSQLLTIGSTNIGDCWFSN